MEADPNSYRKVYYKGRRATRPRRKKQINYHSSYIVFAALTLHTQCLMKCARHCALPVVHLYRCHLPVGIPLGLTGVPL